MIHIQNDEDVLWLPRSAW